MYRHIKRLLDILFALLLILVLSPLIALTAISVLLFSGKPVLFRQLRPGLDAKPFYILKFRSLLNEYDTDGNQLVKSERLTAFGAFIRKSSLDELPSLYNILKGEMSFVGPRPLLMQYLEAYNPREARRHLVRPGLTGLAQINGRNNLDWDHRLRYDIEYVDNISMLLDFKIFIHTIGIVLRAKGIDEEGSTYGKDSFDEWIKTNQDKRL